MSTTKSITEHDNINGITLSLKVEMRHGVPHSRRFTITYKKDKQKFSFWPKLSLVLAIIFNILAVCFVQISLMSFVTIIIVLIFLVHFWITHNVQSESVLVTPFVGIQNSVKYVYGRTDVFIPWINIDDVLINEVFKLNRVLYYLIVIVKNFGKDGVETKLFPLFKNTQPKLKMIETMYAEMQSLLSDAHLLDIYDPAGDLT